MNAPTIKSSSALVLVATLCLAAPAHAWEPAADMSMPRVGHQMVRLDDGNVLVIGGADDASDTSELYDPRTDSFAAPLTMPRPVELDSTAVKVSTGEVLVVGGAAEQSVAVYRNGAWTLGPEMSVARTSPGVIVIGEGAEERVVVFGSAEVDACGADDPRDSLQVYRVATATWEPPQVATIGCALEGALAVSLHDGRGLVLSRSGNTFIYDGTLAPPLAAGFSLLGSTQLLVLPSGDALALSIDYATTEWSSARYDVAEGYWGTGIEINTKRTNSALATLDNGAVVLAGGFLWQKTAAITPVDAVERIEPDGNVVVLPSLDMPRSGTAMVDVGDGSIFLAGGSKLEGLVGVALDSTLRLRFSGFGEVCDSSADCASGFCADGVCCDRACDSPCEACAEPDSAGVCTTISGEPRGERTCDREPEGTCEAQVCSGSSTCVFSAIEEGCLPSCNDTDECAPGLVCDSERHCVERGAVEVSGCGCVVSERRSGHPLALLALGGLLLGLRRRRR